MLQMLRPLIVASLLTFASAAAEVYIPEELEAWKPWVLKDQAHRNCPFFFDQALTDDGHFLCQWPGLLQLDAAADGARFTQQWTLYEEDQWVALPGSTDHWPDQVSANGRAVAVVERNGAPHVRLAPGTWRLAGRFEWDQRPGVLRIPAASGLVALTLDGRAVERPELNANGVFLGERAKDVREADAVRTTVYRLVADDVPTRLLTRVQLDVSGGVREERFGPVLPEEFVPLSLRSPLPAKLEADGTLHLQVRPGTWIIEIAARGDTALDQIPVPATGVNLPPVEVWSYQANDRLRVTAVEGLPPVDPLQADVPSGWETLPAFRVEAGMTFPITERSRGVVAPSNELSLDRTIWLDFDGGGFVVKDTISGQMRTAWRLDMQQPYRLLSATEHGDNLLITKGQDEGKTGVEVRVANVGLETLGRSETRASMPATGWDARFSSVQASLNLPPGHKLLAGPGVDRAIGSWADRWALLDFFLVLIITIATWRLFNPTAGVIALLALALSFHELLAPTWLWLNLLIAIAVLRVAPAGRLFRLVRSYQLLGAALLLIALVPFVANQVRVAIYPQLEPQVDRFGILGGAGLYDLAAPAEQAVPEADSIRVLESQVRAPRAEPAQEGKIAPATTGASQEFARFAPNAIVQAGPGVPSWRWNTYRLTWSGPVDADQEMRLVVMPRWLVSTLRFALVVLVLAFAAILTAELAGRRWTLPGGLTLGRAATPGVATLILGTLLLAASPPAAAEFPDQELLRQLEERLLEPPECVPRCAEIVAASVEITAASVGIELTIHALDQVAIPLPGSQQGWRPSAVLADGSADVQVLRGRDGTLWVRVAPGRHAVTLRGRVPAVDNLEIPFPAPPRVIAVASEAWLVAGVKDRRLTSGSLQLTRLQSRDGADVPRWESSRFPAFARISRQIAMDLDWQVRTTVERIAPLEGALTLEIPLLDGEAIVSGDFAVRDGRVLVSMQPRQGSVSWTSTLPSRSSLTLRAPEGVAWTEVWDVAVGSIWHVTFDGVPQSNVPVRPGAVRRAVFDPRAGEQLELTVVRPESSDGGTLAFDAVTLDVVQGNRSSDVSLALDYRSTRGAQHVIRLPDDAEVTRVAIDGREHTLRAENNALTLPIQPGQHEVLVLWRAPGDMGFRATTPAVELGAPASNIALSMAPPRDRWLLATSGPQLGPAVLYWTEVVVLLIVAAILGRTRLAPLETRHWLILGLGFSTFSWFALALVAVWLLACGARERYGVNALSWWQFNLVQVAIVATTVLALLAILSALPQGLLGTPDMHVTGHDSHAGLLTWFADRSTSQLPLAAAFTVPLWIYKVIILAWALWLSFALVRWMPWVWTCFSKDGFWRDKGTA